VVTNIDPEHLDYYGDMEKVRHAYLEFIHRVPSTAWPLLCIDSANVRGLLPHVRKRFVTYGLSADADWQARDLHVDVSRPLRRVEARRAPGHGAAAHDGPAPRAERARRHRGGGRPRHPVAHRPRTALEEFGGVHRRFEVRGEERDVLVIDDYGHHPEEIRATLRAAREGFRRRLVVVFQPHRYSRTRDLFDEFLTVFDDADLLLLTDIYAAGEKKLDGVSTEALVHALERRGHLDVRHVPERADLAAALLDVVRPGTSC